MIHFDSPFEHAGATVQRVYNDEQAVTRRYWFDVTKDGRVVWCTLVHEDETGKRKYVDTSNSVLLNTVGSDICEYHGVETIYNSAGKPLYEQ